MALYNYAEATLPLTPLRWGRGGGGGEWGAYALRGICYMESPVPIQNSRFRCLKHLLQHGPLGLNSRFITSFSKSSHLLRGKGLSSDEGCGSW